jgi:hypothetical protein
MPVLALGEQGDGRSIALGIDGTWRLEFSVLGAQTAGRGYGALWDGLLGWLMHDPRFESAHLDIGRGCTAGLVVAARARVVTKVDRGRGSLTMEITRLGDGRAQGHWESPVSPDGYADFVVPPLEPGGYEACLRNGPTLLARTDFACERGGDEWADSRPDPERLAALSSATRGEFAGASSVRGLRLPRPIRVTSQRRVSPLVPAWVLTLSAAALLGLHWVLRRRGGLG